MKVYSESNFVLELALKREQHAACEALLLEMRDSNIEILIPAYSLAEPSFVIRVQGKRRRRLADEVRTDANEMARSTGFEATAERIRDVLKLIGESEERERQQLMDTVDRLNQSVTVLPLTAVVIDRAIEEVIPKFRLSFEDSVVLATILGDREQDSTVKAYFVTRDSDFANPDIVSALEERNCGVLFQFSECLRVVRPQA